MKQLFPVEIQEYTTQTFQRKRHTSSKLIYIAFVILFTGCIASFPFIYVDVSSQSRGAVRSVGENNIIQSALYAEVSQTSIFENKKVKKGDTLIRLKTDEIDEQIFRLKERQNENNEFITDISGLLKSSSRVSTPKYGTELSQYQAKLTEQTVSLEQARYEYEISKKLHEKHVESLFNYQQAESRYKAEMSKQRLVKEEQHNAWQVEKTRLEYENRDLQSQLLQLEKRKSQYTLTAPVSGNIVQFNGLQPGNFASPGQVIAQITPNDSLLVECYISPFDIGYIHPRQKVRFQVDAFNYQQWGLLEGNVTEILPDVVNMNNQPFFRVRCSTAGNQLKLANGYRGSIKKGMTLTGRFFLTRRSLYQLLFDKIDNWMNPNTASEPTKK